jgi:hydroxymethylcytosylglucuronate/cytosylglucuronate synthase
VGPLAHEAFLEELSRCDVLLASPGLTTLLEAGSRNVPTICLPPQNLSQIFNARFHTRALGLEELRVVWPKSVFAEEEALALRADGEGRALELIYAGIAAAAGEDDRETADEVRESLRVALRRAAAAEPDWGALARGLGTGGAAQVADAVLELLRRTPAEGASRADDPCP